VVKYLKHLVAESSKPLPALGLMLDCRLKFNCLITGAISIVAIPSELSLTDIPERRKFNIMKAKEFDQKFEVGEDLTEELDFSKTRRVNQIPRRVNIDFPAWVVEELDKEAGRLGITRQALVKVWIAVKLRKAA
jgi:hypothetical protein